MLSMISAAVKSDLFKIELQQLAGNGTDEEWRATVWRLQSDAILAVVLQHSCTGANASIDDTNVRRA